MKKRAKPRIVLIGKGVAKHGVVHSRAFECDYGDYVRLDKGSPGDAYPEPEEMVNLAEWDGKKVRLWAEVL